MKLFSYHQYALKDHAGHLSTLEKSKLTTHKTAKNPLASFLSSHRDLFLWSFFFSLPLSIAVSSASSTVLSLPAAPITTICTRSMPSSTVART
jgi:hypothetical protein